MVLSDDGGYLNTNFELAGLGGDVQYFKINQDYQYSKTFLKYIVGGIKIHSNLSNMNRVQTEYNRFKTIQIK